MSVAAIILAAGRGSRAGGEIPKQYGMLAGKCVLERTLARFAGVGEVDQIVLVTCACDDAVLRDRVRLPDNVTVTQVTGGATRAASVVAGLAAVAHGISRVLIHDAARPLVSDALIKRVLAALDSHQAAAPGVPVTDALWRADGTRVAGPVPRDALFGAQTPQGFHLEAIRRAHAAHPGGSADDVEVALAHGIQVEIVAGDVNNLKLTYAADFARAERILETAMDIRTGQGFDVHRFGAGDHVVLCGVEIPHSHGLEGHSDADVAMHAVTDAIYGALADGDIGQHFPPDQARWKDADSSIFLQHACARAQERGYRICHADCTVICEQPTIGPYAPAMRARMAALTGLALDAMSVKATTSERLGFTGRKEGIAALATVTLVRR
ncbi:MAG: bifunctional 2-C-methyl-D-erythritol 4-phosphate cytidylyltransferase/2-C-methyl-D-erythritol 2,4-cyclodiphosphate synthase [Paracoccaceae bacterium]